MRIDNQCEPTYTAFQGLKAQNPNLLDHNAQVPDIWYVPPYYVDAEGHRQNKATLMEDAKDPDQGLRDSGQNVIYCQGNIGSDEDRAGIVGKLKSEFGRFNVLVNNAGVAPKQRLDPLKATVESYDRLMRINLKGPYFLTQAIANPVIFLFLGGFIIAIAMQRWDLHRRIALNISEYYCADWLEATQYNCRVYGFLGVYEYVGQ